jgi:hypothetical protein
MSNRDRQLLEIAGISVAEAASLLGVSRQAINQRLSGGRSCFSPGEIGLILNDLRRRDSDRILSLTAFIETNYKPSISQHLPEMDVRDLILPARVGHQQLVNAALAGDQLIVVFNANLAHVSAEATFGKAVRSLLSMKSSAGGQPVLTAEVLLKVPNALIKTHVQQTFFRGAPSRDVTFGVLPTVPFIVSATAPRARAFLFLLRSIEEAHPADAEVLWLQASMRAPAAPSGIYRRMYRADAPISFKTSEPISSRKES